jgi:acetyl esterase/lipase
VPEPARPQVTIEENVTFATVDGVDLQCEVFKPPTASGSDPGILLLHGGGWSVGSRAMMRGFGIQMARRGYVCVSSSYRLTDVARWPAQIEDVEAAAAWMRSNKDLGIDPSKLVIWGNSAGGHLSLLAAARAIGTDHQFAAVVSYYGITKFEPGIGTVWERFCPSLFENPTDEDWRDISPITHLKAPYPPTNLLHGAQDEIVDVTQSQLFYDELVKLGVPAELHLYAEAPHAFDMERAGALASLDVVTYFLSRYVPIPEAAA